MKQTFKKLILNTIKDIAKENKIEYSVEHYVSEADNETLNLTDVVIKEIRMVISDDFALVVISGQQYDFEEWRYKNNEKLLMELKELLSMNL